MRDWKAWWKAAGVRAIKTFAQTMIAVGGTWATFADVDWWLVLSSAALAGVFSLVTSLAGLPEIQGTDRITEETEDCSG